MESGKINEANDVALHMSKIEEEEAVRKERENAEALSSMAESSSPSFSVNILVGSSQRNLELAQPENLRYRGGQVPTLPISSTSKEIRDSSSRTGSNKVSTPRGTSKKAGDDDADDDADDENTNVETRVLLLVFLEHFLWLLKTLFVKTVAAHYQCKRFFDRIKEAIFHQHVVEVLSGSPSRDNSGTSTSISQMFSELRRKKKGKREELIKWLRKMKQEKTSAWTMKEFVDVISTSKLSIVADDDDEQKDKKIPSEDEARKAANRIFNKVSRNYTTDIECHMSEKFIKKEDLQPYFDEKEVEDVFLLIKGEAEGEEIKKKDLKEWLLNVYNECKALACSLKDSNTAIEELNRLSSGVILIVIIIAWLLIMGVLTTTVLLFISSQLLLVVFMFGNTLKTVFEATIFVFVVHPFDVNDRCVIDGVQMVVEEMNLLTTVVLKYDNEKIYYPNAVLATKPIGNFYKSPDMSDSIELAVDISTTVDQIKALKEKIENYENSEFWQPQHSVVVKDFDDVNKMKMAFCFTHKMNFQNYVKRNARRSDLILELKTILEDLHIKYHMLPLQAQLIGLGFPPLPR
ncbi:hypothetical protein SLEP1_g23216 [Rubroshorea leprosula]|uniref:Mechanosensitive ion channel MscS domain-containing protein n=1 Tax=Rubroshorea leprosula TaxID=152421 RepID=A0AAV5JNR4_9ROSI|nr:hypothetical protein SLEP1_g23216 [Rubroshorea leprosula]